MKFVQVPTGDGKGTTVCVERVVQITSGQFSRGNEIFDVCVLELDAGPERINIYVPLPLNRLIALLNGDAS